MSRSKASPISQAYFDSLKLNPIYKGGDKRSFAGGDIQKMITKLPFGEIHLPGHQFTGPGTRLDEKLNPDDTPKEKYKPINRIDQAALKHDIIYRDNKDIKTRHEADREMIKELDSIENPTFRKG